MAKPIPVPNVLTQPFWSAANDGRLVIHRCRDCQRYQHPPHPFCQSCGSGEVGYEPVSGKGRVHAYTFVHEARYRSYAEIAPYTVAAVELVEQTGLILLSNLPGIPQDQVRPGLDVTVEFERLSADIALPQFGPAKPATEAR